MGMSPAGNIHSPPACRRQARYASGRNIPSRLGLVWRTVWITRVEPFFADGSYLDILTSLGHADAQRSTDNEVCVPVLSYPRPNEDVTTEESRPGTVNGILGGPVVDPGEPLPPVSLSRGRGTLRFPGSGGKTSTAASLRPWLKTQERFGNPAVVSQEAGALV